jgi:hypothetical protein
VDSVSLHATKLKEKRRMEVDIGHEICVSFLSTSIKTSAVDKYLASYAGITSEMRAEIHADRHVKSPLVLSDFNTNRNGLTCFSKATQDQIPLISDQLLWSCMQTERQKEGHGKVKRRIFAIFLCELIRKIRITQNRTTGYRIRSRIIFSSRWLYKLQHSEQDISSTFLIINCSVFCYLWVT